MSCYQCDRASADVPRQRKLVEALESPSAQDGCVVPNTNAEYQDS